MTIAPDALARIVWAAPIEDLYTLAGGDGMPAFAALGWATAHAAAARRDAAAALAALERVETKLDRLLAALPPSST